MPPSTAMIACSSICARKARPTRRTTTSCPAGNRPASGGADRAEIRDHIGQEFFRFEIATAVAGAILGINPFNSPSRSRQDQDPRTDQRVRKIRRTSSGDADARHRAGRPLYRRHQRRGAAQGRRRWRSRLVVKAHFGRTAAGDYVACSAISSATRDHIDAHAKHADGGCAIASTFATLRRIRPASCTPRRQAYKAGGLRRVPADHADDSADLACPAQAPASALSRRRRHAAISYDADRTRRRHCGFISRATSPPG